MKRSEFILTPFHCRARLINTFLIPYITPFLHLSRKNWNSFLTPIKESLWRNKLTGGNPWQWGKWSAVACPKSIGGLGILDPVTHSQALCAKLFCTLATSTESESWASMAREMVMATDMRSKGGTWQNLSIENRLLPSAGVRTKLGGFTGRFVQKCCNSAGTLRWHEQTRYWKGTTGH